MTPVALFKIVHTSLSTCHKVKVYMYLLLLWKECIIYFLNPHLFGLMRNQLINYLMLTLHFLYFFIEETLFVRFILINVFTCTILFNIYFLKSPQNTKEKFEAH